VWGKSIKAVNRGLGLHWTKGGKSREDILTIKGGERGIL